MNWIRCYLFPKKNVNPPATQIILYIEVDTIDKDTSAKAAEAEIDSGSRFHSLTVTKLTLMPTLLHLDAPFRQ